MTELVVLGFYTIWFTPIIFIASLLGAIENIHKGESMKVNAIMCVISFWLIVVPMFIMVVEGS